jgi:hypothetical protein
LPLDLRNLVNRRVYYQMSTPKQVGQDDTGGDLPPWNEELRDMIRAEVSQVLFEELPRLVTRISDRLMVRMGRQVERDAGTAQSATRKNEKLAQASGSEETVQPASKMAPEGTDRGKRKNEEELPYPNSIVKCYECKQRGHFSIQCPRLQGAGGSNPVIAPALERDDLQCNMCGKSGHTRKNCIGQLYRRQRFRS